MPNKLPNFIYIGPDKAGSTWLFKVLEWHPDTYVTSCKDTQFFDNYYEKGLDWYKKQFNPRGEYKVISEISHNYLYSEKVARRIQDHLGNINLMVTLREPTERAYSAYLYLLKHDLYRGTFKEAISDVEEIKEHGNYLSNLNTYLELFGKENVYVAVFDNLKKDPTAFATNIFRFLEVDHKGLPQRLTQKTLPAAQPRSRWISHVVKRLAWIFRDTGFPSLVGKIKTSPLVHRILYKPHDNKPSPDEDAVRYLRSYYSDMVIELDKHIDANVRDQWGYS